MDIFWKIRGIGTSRGRLFWLGVTTVVPCAMRVDRRIEIGAPEFLGLGYGNTDGGEGFFVNGDEEAFGSGEDGAVGVLDFGVVEELAAGGAVCFCWAADVAADENERLVERDGAEVVDLHVAGHREDVERTVEFAHGFVEEGGDDATVDMARGPLVHAVELEVRGGGDGVGVRGVGGEDEVKPLGIGGAAAKAEVGALVDGGRGFEEGWGVSGGIGADFRFGHGRGPVARLSDGSIIQVGMNSGSVRLRPYAIQTSRMPGPNFSAFSWPRPWMDFSCARFCGRVRTMLRSVVEARTKKRGRSSLSDSAFRQSRRRWSSCCCSGVRESVGSEAVVRWRVKVSWELRANGMDVSDAISERPSGVALAFFPNTICSLSIVDSTTVFSCQWLRR